METTQRNSDRTTASQDLFASKWQQMRGTLRSWWGKLTDDDWERISGQKDRLIGMLQEKYGYAKDMAIREVERRFQEYNSHSSRSSEGLGSSTTYAGQEAKTTAQNVGQSISGGYGEARAKAQEFGAAAADKIGSATKAAGEKMSSLAGTLRENAPQQGSLGSAADAVARKLDTTGSYLQEMQVEDMARDLTGLIRRYPLYAMLVGLGIGYLFSRNARR